MSKVAKEAISLLLTVWGNPKAKSHIRLIRGKAPLLPHAAARLAIRRTLSPEGRVLFDDREANR